MDCTGGPAIITTVLIRGQQESQRCDKRSRDWNAAGWQAKECEQPLETKKDKETDSCLESLCKEHSFADSFEIISNFQNSTIVDYHCFKPQNCGNLL